VIRLGAGTTPSEDRFEGWVEEVDSGKELRFHSISELVEFLGERLCTAFPSRGGGRKQARGRKGTSVKKGSLESFGHRGC